MIAYFVSNICVKNYQNRCVEVIACNISVVKRMNVTHIFSGAATVQKYITTTDTALCLEK